jgi:hypothetical protein
MDSASTADRDGNTFIPAFLPVIDPSDFLPPWPEHSRNHAGVGEAFGQ